MAPQHMASSHGSTSRGLGARGGAAAENPLVGDGLRPAPPKRKRHIGRIVGWLLIVASLVTLGVSGWMLWDAFSKYGAQDRNNASLEAHVQVSDDTSTAPVVDWAALKAIDPHVCAWVQIPGTVINFPVYQGDDNDYYLNTTAYGEYGVGGQIFMDCENQNPGLVDEQTIIYGHHLQNGSMFAVISDFDEQDVFDEHSTVWYVTEQNDYELTPLLCYRTLGSDENVRLFQWPTVDEFHDYLRGLADKAEAKVEGCDQIIEGTDHVLTLSTCSYEEHNGRTLLVCVPKQEAAKALGGTGA